MLFASNYPVAVYSVFDFCILAWCDERCQEYSPTGSMKILTDEVKSSIVMYKYWLREILYETICYVCIALAIAMKNNCYSQCYS